MKFRDLPYATGFLPAKATDPFPTFAELGGPEVISNTLGDARQGLAVFSGRSLAGKTTAMVALANELQRDGRNVLSVRQPTSPSEVSMPNLKEWVIDPALDAPNRWHLSREERSGFNAELRDFIAQEKPEVVVLGEIHQREAGQFAIDLAQSGILVLASIHASTPWDALIKLVQNFGCEKQNKEIADSLLFSYGMELSPDPYEPTRTQSDVIANAVLEADHLRASVRVLRAPVSWSDPLGEWEVVQVPSSYDPHKFLQSTILFPDEEVRGFIMSSCRELPASYRGLAEDRAFPA